MLKEPLLSSICVAFAALTLAVGLKPTLVEAARLAAATKSRDCFQELARGQGPVLECDYPTWLSTKERDDLHSLTRGMLQDARCSVSIRISRALVARALTELDYVFEAPAQPVVCEISTQSQSITIEATFAPRVVIMRGRATAASPGLANVKGVNSYLAWPVVEYINRSTTVRTEMLRMINAYLATGGRAVRLGSKN